jgi:hypothetical protein
MKDKNMDNFDLKKYLVENKVTTNSKMIPEASYISPEGDLHIEDGENTELGYAIENALDSWPLSDIEMGPDVFVEGLLDYFADFDPTFRQPPGMLKGDTLENEVIATAKAYKEGAIDLKTAVSQFRKTLSNRNYYTGRG